ncbi:MAG TPA: hypothetical protein VEI48_01725 [Candidatus Sulfotelmatobacter sp.]|nr:hypothetical protein [Candidatus Sulfotelmatobacter sp.]
MTDDLERRLRTSLSTAALPSAPDSLLDALDRLPDDVGPIGTGAQRVSLAWAMPVLAVVVVLALIAAWMPGGLLGPAGPTASPRGSQSTSPSAAPDIEWTKAASTGNDIVDSMVALPGGGYLGVGSVYATQGVLWSSPDGRSWQRTVATDPALAGSVFDQIVLLPHGGLLLVGEDATLDGKCGGGAAGCNPVNQLRMWTSSDGHTWRAVPATGLAAFGRVESVQVVVGPTGLVASGVVAPVIGDLSSSIWTSLDGTTWTQATQFHQTFPNAVIDAIVATPTGVAVTGQLDVHAIPSGTDGGAWYSTDGTTWAQAALPTGSPILGDLATVPGGALGVTIDPESGALSTWRTTDGSSWQKQPPFELGTDLPRFLSDGSWVVELFTATGRAWISTDATSWQPLSQTNPPPLDGFVTGALSATGLVVVIGSDIWFGSWTEPATTSVPTSVARSSTSPSPTLATGPEVDDFGLFDAQHGWAESNGHLFLTADDGSTWVDQGSIGSDYYAAITFASPDVAFAQSGPLFERTTDAGRTWEPLALPTHAGTAASFSFFSPSSGYLLMSASGNGPGTLLSTTDAGATWTVVATTPAAVVGGIRFIDAQDGWAVGTQEPFPPTGRPTLDALFATRDGGHSWQATTFPVPTGYQAADLQEVSGLPMPAGDGAYELSAEYLSTERLAWVTEYLITTDGGATWQVGGTLPGEDNGPVAPFDAQHWLAFLSTPDGSASTFYTTDDAGGTWSPMSPAGLPPGFFVGFALRFADRQHGWAIVDGVNRDVGGNLNLNLQLYGTSDGGQTWHLLFGSQPTSPTVTAQPTSPVPGATATALAFVDAETGLSVGSTATGNGAVWHTSDGGRTWSVPIALPLAQPTSVAVWGTQDAWIGVDCDGSTNPCGPGVLASVDGGYTWQRASATDVTSLSFTDATHGWATLPGGPAVGGASGGLLSTADGGRTWSSRGNPCPTGGWPAAVSFPDAHDGWVGCTGPSAGGTAPKWVLGTTDAGTTWTVRAGVSIHGSGPSVGSIDFGDTLAGIAMRSDGVGTWWGVRGETQRTADGGRSWLAGQPGQFDVVIPASISLPTDTDWFALTWDGNAGKQVVEASHDGGRSWTTISAAPTAQTATTVTVPLGSTHQIAVTIDDQSGSLTGAQPLVLPAGTRIPAEYGTSDITAWNPGGQPSPEVWLYWGGVICDVTSTLSIGQGAASMTVTEGPYPACDAANVGRGLALTFSAPVDAATTTVSLVPTAPTQAAPANVQAAGLLDASHGWAWTDQKLVVTSDGGASWSDLTAPGGFAGSRGDSLGVTFTDPRHGWIAFAETFTAPTDPGYGRIDIWRTTDGGASWAKSELPKAVINRFGEILPPVQFDFLDAAHGFAFLSGDLAKGANDSDLFYTADGGRTWSVDRPTGGGSVGIEGSIAFATPNDGVVVNADVGSGIAMTHDGGRTWTNAAFSLPAGSTRAQLFFGQPVFADGRTGVVAVDFQSDSGSVTHLIRTSDAGSSWTDVAALPAGFSWVSVIDQQHWVAFSDAAVRHTDDGGATWTQTVAVPPTSHEAGPQFVDDIDGWWPAGDGLNAVLYATTDGGVTWQALAP